MPLRVGGLPVLTPSDIAAAARSLLGWTDEAVQVVADLPARVAVLVEEAERLLVRVGGTLDRVDAAVDRVGKLVERVGVVADEAEATVGRVGVVADEAAAVAVRAGAVAGNDHEECPVDRWCGPVHRSMSPGSRHHDRP